MYIGGNLMFMCCLRPAWIMSNCGALCLWCFGRVTSQRGCPSKRWFRSSFQFTQSFYLIQCVGLYRATISLLACYELWLFKNEFSNNIRQVFSD